MVNVESSWMAWIIGAGRQLIGTPARREGGRMGSEVAGWMNQFCWMAWMWFMISIWHPALVGFDVLDMFVIPMLLIVCWALG